MIQDLPLICFDWDGTIADSMQLCIDECRAALLEMDLPDLPDETLRLCNGPTNYDGCRILGVPDEKRDAFLIARARAGLERMEQSVTLFPGVRAMLEALRGRANMAVVSNGQAEYIDKSITHFGLEGVFCATRAYTPGMTKADLLADVVTALDPPRAIMVGDRLGDLAAGKACGLPTVAACYGFGTDAEYAEADLRCHTAEELTECLLAWVKG